MPINNFSQIEIGYLRALVKCEIDRKKSIDNECYTLHLEELARKLDIFENHLPDYD